MLFRSTHKVVFQFFYMQIGRGSKLAGGSLSVLLPLIVCLAAWVKPRFFFNLENARGATRGGQGSSTGVETRRRHDCLGMQQQFAGQRRRRTGTRSGTGQQALPARSMRPWRGEKELMPRGGLHDAV